jgi:hypothetical protein
MEVKPPVSPRWMIWPLIWFVPSFGLVYVSTVFAKGRDLARRDEAAKRKHKPDDTADEDDRNGPAKWDRGIGG